MTDENDIKEMAEVQVSCRTFGHAWDVQRVTVDKVEGAIFDLSCLRCATTRVDRVNRHNGDLDGRSYGYAEGYLGHGRVARSTWRFEFVKRHTNGKRG
jgi:hypothetical protein